MFRYPKHFQGGKRIDHQVGLIDVTPTLLDLLGIPAPDEFQGMSLVPLTDGGEPEPRFLFSEALSTLPPAQERPDGRVQVYIYPEMENEADWAQRGVTLSRRELFNLSTDHLERENIADTEQGLMQFFQRQVDRFLSMPDSAGASGGRQHPRTRRSHPRTPEIARLHQIAGGFAHR